LVSAPILRKSEVEESKIYVKQMVHDEGKQCVTSMRVVRRMIIGGKQMSLMAVSPKTGRMHQIRVHAAHVGHPIVGDKIYGGNEEMYLRFIEDGMDEKMLSKLILHRHALHASRMHIMVHGELRQWKIDLAPDIGNLISKEAGIQ